MRRDLLLRHDRTVHAKDPGEPLQSESRKKAPATASKQSSGNASPPKQDGGLDSAPLDGIAMEDMDVDIEAAALLMTDFRHKAMDSMMGVGADDGGTGAGSALLEPSVSYPNGAVALPQMAEWDHIHAMQDAKPFAMPSAIHHHHPEPHHAFNAASRLHPHANTLPALMERQGSNPDGLTSSFPGANGRVPSISMSDTGTPGALSPFPSMLGPVSPVDYRR